MSHLSLRINSEDERHLEILEHALGLNRSEAAKRALLIAADFISQQKPDKLLLLEESEFVGADQSKKMTRLNYKQKLKGKLEAKYGLQQKK